MTVTGPYAPRGASETPSRGQIFVCRPAGPDEAEAEACAQEILSTLTRRAFRRPVSAEDVKGPMAFYREGRSAGDFDAGIEKALGALLINPEFLFRVELDPDGVAAGDAYRVSDLELASRLSFFLWSSIPDDELLDAAVRGELSRPDELERQTRRMLADPRASNLASNFAGQWLQLRIWRPSARTRGSTRTSTTTCGRRSARRPSASSTACCGKTGAWSTCSTRTTPF